MMAGSALSDFALASAMRFDEAIEAARDAGRDEGEQVGYVRGWRYGLICGALAGAVAGGGVVALVALAWFYWGRDVAVDLSRLV